MSADEFLRNLRKNRIPTYMPFSSSKRDEEDDSRYSNSNPFNIYLPKIKPYSFLSKNESEERAIPDTTTAVLNQLKALEFHRIAERVNIQMDIDKARMRGSSAGLHPIARLEALKMGIRP